MAFLAPFVGLYVLFIIGPAIYGLVMSFFDTSLVKPGLSTFAGLGNYAEALQSADFWSSLWHTIWGSCLPSSPTEWGAVAGSSGWHSSRRSSCRRQ
jgi:multiple sugar transport system permease protein